MARKLREPPTPTGLERWALRVPIKLYEWGLGPLLGRRFLLLRHTGAKTGLTRRTPLEVVKHEPDTGRYYVAVGFGRKSRWYNNLKQTPDAEIQVGRRTIDVRAEELNELDGGELMVDYAHRYPKAARALMKFCGYEVDGSDDDYRDVTRLGMRFMRLQRR